MALIADRYVLLHKLGRGGHGEVWEADDRLTETKVAVKLLDGRGGSEPARVRREVAALRLLRLPGVVRMLDEGIDRGVHFLVMERIFGAPFPGRRGPASWTTVADVTVRLLQTLGRIHAAGVIHRDLKPENVLVGSEDRPTILDFGLSRAGSLAGGLTIDGMILGTPAYLAPEQIRGGHVSAATDLYALGVMLYESLAARLPHRADNFVDLMRARLTEPFASLAEVAPDVPPNVARLVDRLLGQTPDERPRCAEEALDDLCGRPAAVAFHLPVQTEADLRAIFVGPDRVLHLRQDAARELWTRTEGLPDKIAVEVDGWVKRGLARRDGDRFSIDRESIDFLESERALAAAKARSRGAAGEIAAEAIAAALPAAHAGRLGHAVALLAEGLFAARKSARRRRAAGWGEAKLLGVWMQIAIADSTPRTLDRLLYEVCRAGERTQEVDGIEGTIRAALALRTAAGDRALAMIDATVPAFEDPELDRARQHVRVLAARRGPAAQEEALLDEVAAWAAARGDEEAEMSLADWRGRLRYRQGRFAEAAELHARAAERGRWTTARIDARLNGASALMEGFSFDAAKSAAEAGRALAEACRHAYFEARAEWILRTIAYRVGVAGAPDAELVELAARVDVAFLEGAVSLTEGAVARRAGRIAEALALARRAERIFTGKGREAGALLARSLAIACGGDVREGDIAALVERAIRCSVPGIGVQALGLLCLKDPAVRPLLREAEGPLTAAIPRGQWGERMDILSVEEALSAARDRG